MGVVTAIEPQKRKGRVNIFVDGQFVVGLTFEELAKAGLRVGSTIGPEEIEELIKKTELNKLLERAYKFLSYRPRSEKEVRDYLFQKKATPAAATLVIKKLKVENLINDQDFVKWWIGQRARFRPKGRRLVKGELLKKGVEAQLVDRILAQEYKESLELDLALSAAKKKYPLYKNLAWPKLRQKMGEFLLRRGFDWETVREVLGRLKFESKPK